MAARSGGKTKTLPSYEYSPMNDMQRIQHNREAEVDDRLEVYVAGEENVLESNWFDLERKMNLGRQLYPRQTYYRLHHLTWVIQAQVNQRTALVHKRLETN